MRLGFRARARADWAAGAAWVAGAADVAAPVGSGGSLGSVGSVGPVGPATEPLPVTPRSAHPQAWLAEFAGTALLFWAIITAKLAAVDAGPPFSGLGGRIAVVGTVAGAAVIAVVYSPLGRVSGGHLNPAVTFGLWIRRDVSTPDLAGYCVAQVAGGLAGTFTGRMWSPDLGRAPVGWAVIAPGTGAATALMLEVVATGLQMAVVYAMLASDRLRPATGAAAGALLTAAIIALARSSGAGFNPVRGLANDVAAGSYPGLWIYLVGPMTGAGLAAVLVPGRRPAS